MADAQRLIRRQNLPDALAGRSDAGQVWGRRVLALTDFADRLQGPLAGAAAGPEGYGEESRIKRRELGQRDFEGGAGLFALRGKNSKLKTRGCRFWDSIAGL